LFLAAGDEDTKKICWGAKKREKGGRGVYHSYYLRTGNVGKRRAT